jgi:hypothetical protein
MNADYLPSLWFWYLLSYHAYWERITFLKHPNSRRKHTEFWVMRERHGSRAWLVLDHSTTSTPCIYIYTHKKVKHPLIY